MIFIPTPSATDSNSSPRMHMGEVKEPTAAESPGGLLLLWQ